MANGWVQASEPMTLGAGAVTLAPDGVAVIGRAVGGESG